MDLIVGTGITIATILVTAILTEYALKPLTLSGGSITDFHPLSDQKLNICQSDFCRLVVDPSANPTFGRVGETIL